MSQSWISRLRDREAESDDDAYAGHPLPDGASNANEEDKSQPVFWVKVIVRGLVAGAFIAWIALIGWSFVDPSIGARLAPFLELVSRLSVPLLFVVGIAIFVMMLAGHWDTEESGGSRLSSEDAREAATQAAQAAARIADAHAQMLNQTKAYAAAADRSASALLSAVTTIDERGDILARTTAASVQALTTLTERMDAFDESTPKLERRLSELTETLACLGVELRERSTYLETRLREAAAAAGETRDELIAAGDSLNDKLTKMRQNTRAAGEELTGLSELSSARIDFTLDRVKTILDATEQRIEVHNEALTRLVERSRESVETSAQHSLDRFLGHCREIEATLDTLDTRITQQSEKGSAWLEKAAEGAQSVAAQFDALESSALSRTERLGTAMMELSVEARRLTDALVAGDQSSELLIKRAEGLLLALDSGVRELDESVPSAIARVEERITALRARIAETMPGIESVETVAQSVAGRLEDSAKLSANHAATLDDALARSQTALADQRVQVEALAGAIAEASDSLAGLTDRAGPEMVEALARVRETAADAASKANDAIMDVIPQAAAKLSEASSEAVRSAVTETVDRQLERLTDAADQAVKTANATAAGLDTQLKALHATSDALDRRLANSARKAETQDRELLTKRSGELIEMLNSRAIDVSKWLGHDISQPEWTAYLKGDQGIFARRAVKMLSYSDARAVRKIYKEDDDFAEHVNRYVHDFETLLKSVLEAKDGSALAVTMLSSDLGKLYVALAQASERLKGA
jgi:rRNA-processing protein FCF1